MSKTEENDMKTGDGMARVMQQLCPPPVFSDTPDSTGDSDSTTDMEADEVIPEASGDSGGKAEEESNPNQYGYVPCYRTFRDQWFWMEKPWDVAHLFIDLLMRANRTPRIAKHAGKVQPVARGQVVTSKVKLAEVTGRDRKTVTKWLKHLEESGEINVKNLGRSGIIITVCKYELYALDQAKQGQRKGQRSGHPKGQHCG